MEIQKTVYNSCKYSSVLQLLAFVDIFVSFVYIFLIMSCIRKKWKLFHTLTKVAIFSEDENKTNKRHILKSVAWHHSPSRVEFGINAEGWGKSSRGR
jgi:hypothetical protein